MNEKVKAKIDLLTSKPGVYLMKDESGTIIYVGKAKSLIKRVKQYFLRPQEGKVFRMVREIDDFDTIETLNEKEALLLEINLIRKYYPKYNILLKDGKSYPYIALNKKGDPFLKIAYNDKDKNFKYFGPYPNSQACYKTIDLLNKLFPLRKCQHLKTEPCLYYHLGQCLGPCIKKVSEEEYIPLINEINHFLNGDTSKIKEKLKLEMMDASEKLEFEKAKEIKDILDSIEKVVIKQNIQLQDHIDRDVISLSTRDGYYSICIMTYRKGNLLGKDVFIMEEFEDYEEEFIENVFQYYLSHNIPKEIIVSNKEIGEKLSYLLERKVISPTRGVKKDLLLIAYENAKNGLDEHFLTARLEDDTLSLLNELGDLLKIKTPLHIELFDNSHLQGSFPIGAMVVFINGVKVPSEYRKFNIQESSGKDDLKSMEEVIRRRYTRLLIEDKKMPDLIIVDGGENQINVAREVLDNLMLNIPVCGLSKNDKHHTNGLIYNNELHYIDKKSRLFLMLVRMQDEVHRYAITFHKDKRGKGLTSSIYDDIKGIGKKRKESLEKAFPSLDSLKKASLEELSQIVPLEIALKIKEKIK
ncbi:MAG: excinuclease ABC subunit C [Erysipelotrichaceae bacterium]|nr:excinuclease ABC subunit C [Erysipelotrichaceae bacterium]